MREKYMMDVNDVIAELGVSKSKAYQILRQLNKSLEEEGYTPTLVNARFIKPLDTDLLEELKKEHELIVTMEENIASGGYGSAVTYWVGQQKNPIRILPISLPDIYLEHGSVSELKDRYGLTAKKMAERILETIE